MKQVLKIFALPLIVWSLASAQTPDAKLPPLRPSKDALNPETIMNPNLHVLPGALAPGKGHSSARPWRAPSFNKARPFKVTTGPEVSFLVAPTYPVDSNNLYSSPHPVAIEDLNGDGQLDLVVVNDSVSVLLGNGNGTFEPAVSFAAGLYPQSVAVGDLNGDGKPDLVTPNFYDQSISVMFGNGDGTFQTAVTNDYGITGEPGAIAFGDVNGDGKLDIVTSGIWVLLGNGNGTFQTAMNFAAGFSYSVSIGDLNGDGKPDLVTTPYFTPNLVLVLLGNGDGTFQPASGFAAGRYPYSAAIGDL